MVSGFCLAYIKCVRDRPVAGRLSLVHSVR